MTAADVDTDETIAEILSSVEGDPDLSDVESMAAAVADLAPPTRDTIEVLAFRLIDLRARRGYHTPAPVVCDHRHAPAAPATPEARWPETSTVGSHKRPSGASPGSGVPKRPHASPRVLAASTAAWRDLLGSKMSMGGRPVQVLDMNASELVKAADMLHDASERLHTLAGVLERSNVVCARHLPQEALAAIESGAT